MIVDRIANAGLYAGMGKRIALALDYLRKTDFGGVKAGRYEIEGANVYALVQERSTRPRESALWEAHRKYFDIQYLFEGVELMGYANVGDLAVCEDYDAEKDMVMLKGEGDFFVLRPGRFAIFGPEDAHMPCLALTAPQPVKKVVVKVRVS